MDLTPKQQTSEAIRQAETILIITGQHPSVDQVAAVMALSAILRKFGKKVSAIVSDNPPAATQMLDMGTVERGLGGSRDFVLKVDVNKAEVDKLRYEVEGGKLNIYLTPFKGSFAPSDVTFGYGAFHYDLAIVLGVPTRARIDKIYEQNMNSFETIPMVNLDFHRSNENYGAVNLIEPNASSLCEMLVALSESLQSGIIEAEIATALLMGIVASTDRFTASHTSPKSLTVAAQMMAAGAKQQAVVRALYRDGKGGESRSNEQPRERGDRDRDRKSDGGSDRRNDGERKPDNDRKPDGERKSDSDRNNNDRGERNNERERTQRPAAPQPASQAQPQAAQAPVQQSAPVQAQQLPVQAPAPVQPPAPQYEAPVASPAPIATAQMDDEPIIQPGHIELMPEEREQPTAARPSVAATPVEEQPQPSAAPVQPAPQPAPDRPQAMPIADFAAAAEMFNRDQA